MITIALGGLFGQIPFGPVRFGAAGALFMGLVVGALDPRFGQGLELVKSLGVVLFCYTVGLAAGTTFRSDLRRQWHLMVAGTAGLVVMAVGGALLAAALGLTPAHVAGLYAGVLTSPAIDTAIAVTDASPDTLVGYALAYPTGVVVGMVLVALLVGRRWPGRRDAPSLAEAGLVARSVRVERATELTEIPGYAAQAIKLSYHERDGDIRVLAPGQALRPGDRVLCVGAPDDVARAAAVLGHTSTRKLTHDRRDVDFRRFVVSNPALFGRTVADLNVTGALEGIVTRVRRGDIDMLARDDLILQPGDRVLAVVPRAQLEGAATFFGDSERRVSQLDALSLGVGICLGLLVGYVTVPLPGGLQFGLGAAAGPLVVGMVLGALHRTGPVRWDLPHAVNATTRQVGFMVFLASVGLASGTSFVQDAFTLTGLKVVGLAGLVLVLGAAVLVGAGRLLGLSAQRTAGALTGFIGQPAILAYANSRVNDERIDSAYGALFALGTIVKILLVQLIVVL
ncbi:aspartate:alanine exchanger family transporter [Propioniciclava soli]|uniref:TrkA C-terminal domain-containing protein n=1 Tax=Propioniciclava soli TaxID=2775081 RepID=A0ABZ3CBR2_9ACTN|nr:TrkA C-terminal domain-containing protein [Propioniciclava soli]